MTAHDAAVAAISAEMVGEGNVPDDYDRDDARRYLTALAASPAVRAALVAAVDAAVETAVCEPDCSPHLHGVRLAVDAVMGALGMDDDQGAK